MSATPDLEQRFRELRDALLEPYDRMLRLVLHWLDRILRRVHP